MHVDCEEGVRLCLLFEKHLREWGWFDAYSKALELMPVGFPKVGEFNKQVKLAESELFAARHAYVNHLSQCLICSRGLVAPDAIAKITEILRRSESAPCESEKEVGTGRYKKS